MTTADFIKNTYNTEATKERRCSSVFTDYKGNVYSYGYHYPLLFNIDGLDFVNTAGYSNTTAKHIGWARRAVDYKAISVELPSRRALPVNYTLSDMLLILDGQRSALVETMNNKTRRDTQVYADLERQFAKVMHSIATVSERMGA